MRTEEELCEDFLTCKKILSAMNIKYGNVTEFQIKDLGRRYYGLCTRLNPGEADPEYRIEISDIYLDERTPAGSMRGTMLHELLHTVKGCMNHGTYWQSLGKIVMKSYPELKIFKKRSYDREKGRFEREIPEQVVYEHFYSGRYKYMIYCPKCSYNRYFSRRCKRLDKFDKNPKCGFCGGNKVLYDLRKEPDIVKQLFP